MKKWLAVYSVAKQKARLKFGAAICEIDENCSDIIQDHATLFISDREKNELHRILISECLIPGDEAWIFEVINNFTGNGIALDDVSAIMNS